MRSTLCALAFIFTVGCQLPTSEAAGSLEEPKPVATSEMVKLRPHNVSPTHGSGQMAMSPDGKFIAFIVLGTPSNQFAIISLDDKSVRIVEAPSTHKNIGDLEWSPDGDDLTFLTAEGYVIQGTARHVWRLRVKDGEPEITLLAEIPLVRHPVLSADGRKLAAFEGLIFTTETTPPPYAKVSYAIFDRSVETGKSTRRSIGQFATPLSLFYDPQSNLYMAAHTPEIAERNVFDGRVYYDWSGVGGAFEWDRKTRNIRSFRIPKGEMLAVWPETFPQRNAPKGAWLTRPLDDGRVVVYGSLDEASTHWSNWYTPEGKAQPSGKTYRYDYIAYDKDGNAEVLPTVDSTGRTGGADLSGNGRRFAMIKGVCTSTGCEDHRLSVYDNGSSVFTASIENLLAEAPVIQVKLEETPIMPIENDDYRREPPPRK